LDDREIDLNLIDPAGGNRGMYKKGVGPAASEAIDRLLTAMSRAVFHDPKDALGGLWNPSPSTTEPCMSAAVHPN
jgi:hypothetical protein